jgi:ATP-binding cassette subfamily C (CFTR/MRP) protein 1
MAGSMLMFFGCVRAAVRLHNNMADKIFKSPMMFFDTTPMGRVLNRFAKDLDVCDTALPDLFKWFLICFTAVSAFYFFLFCMGP